ncbi:uncharacterized protein LOC142632504 [Castanea sativa]|uniref:uncharacterized protein LOC142632504 n=1 Tax=Castanea sativa TaxID=21020 RepID=UPI003F64E2C9
MPLPSKNYSKLNSAGSWSVDCRVSIEYCYDVRGEGRNWNGMIEVVSVKEKSERVVKASRDITINSKKVIFQVHRISKHNREEVLEKAEKDLKAVTDQYISQLVKELHGTDFWKLRRAYSTGVASLCPNL